MAVICPLDRVPAAVGDAADEALRAAATGRESVHEAAQTADQFPAGHGRGGAHHVQPGRRPGRCQAGGEAALQPALHRGQAGGPALQAARARQDTAG